MPKLPTYGHPLLAKVVELLPTMPSKFTRGDMVVQIATSTQQKLSVALRKRVTAALENACHSLNIRKETTLSPDGTHAIVTYTYLNPNHHA